MNEQGSWAAIPTLSCVHLKRVVEVWELAADWVGREEAGSLVLSIWRSLKSLGTRMRAMTDCRGHCLVSS